MIKNKFIRKLSRMEPLSKVFWICTILLLLSSIIVPIRYLLPFIIIVLLVYIAYFIDWIK